MKWIVLTFATDLQSALGFCTERLKTIVKSVFSSRITSMELLQSKTTTVQSIPRNSRKLLLIRNKSLQNNSTKQSRIDCLMPNHLVFTYRIVVKNLRRKSTHADHVLMKAMQKIHVFLVSNMKMALLSEFLMDHVLAASLKT